MKSTPLLILLAALAAFCALGCGSSAPVVAGDTLSRIQDQGATLRMDARLYQPDEAHGVIYFKLRTADLLYKGSGGGGPYHARVLMSYETYAINSPKTLLDSASTYIKDQCMTTGEDKELIGTLPIKLAGDAPFIIRLSAHDLNRDSRSTQLIRVERGAAGTRQDFLPMDPGNLPLFGDRVPPGSKLELRSESLAGTRLFVDHYPPVEKLPAPVFANSSPPQLDGPPDSTFILAVPPDGTLPFTAGSAGFYQFRGDTTMPDGYTLFVAPAGFPEIHTVAGMIAPMRYITSEKEWQALSTAPDVRKAMEQFWTDAAGSRERARQTMAAYYGRVENANRYFSSYTEGWKTDRGLVHIIFGTPTTVRTDANGETWTYGDESNLLSLVFRFVRRNEPFSDNDLVLQRDPMLKSAWYRNVESWRNGRIMQN
jgi:GWxTD domain-containing protein